MDYDEEEYLMLSGLQHFAFCRRQWALIHIEQQWAENYWTTKGDLFHENAHNEQKKEKRGNTLIVRGMRIFSRTLGVSGQCDVVEFHKDKDGIRLNDYDGLWTPIPIEYKVGEPKESDEDILQLCGQAMCLEEMLLTEIPYGYLFYGTTKRRTEVDFTPELRQKVKDYLEEMHQLFDRAYTPKVKTSKKCKSCSLKDICVPKLQKNKDVSAYISKAVSEL